MQNSPERKHGIKKAYFDIKKSRIRQKNNLLKNKRIRKRKKEHNIE